MKTDDVIGSSGPPDRDDAVSLGLEAIMHTSHADGSAVLARVRAANAGGFLTPRDVHMLASDARTRLTRLLIRCGGCRFTCPAQDAHHLISIIEQDDRDYVRDVSLPAEAMP